jgi:hypothetical protein
VIKISDQDAETIIGRIPGSNRAIPDPQGLEKAKCYNDCFKDPPKKDIDIPTSGGDHGDKASI